MNHKKKKPKNQRAGCLMCKPWKINGMGKESKSNAKPADFRQIEDAKEQIDGVVRNVKGGGR